MRATHHALGAAGAGRPRGVAARWRARAAGLGGTRRIWRQRNSGLPVQRHHDRRVHRDRLGRIRLRAAQRCDGSLPAGSDHRRTETAVASRLGLRRAHHRDRDDRTRSGVRPESHYHDGQTVRWRLSAQRREDLHHQRHPRRSCAGGREDRSWRGPPRNHPVDGRAGRGRICPGPQSRQDRHESPRHCRTVLRGRLRPSHQRGGGAGTRLLSPDEGVGSGTSRLRGHLHRGHGARPGADRGIRPDPNGFRSATRRISKHPVRVGGREGRNGGLPHIHRRSHFRAGRR